MHKFDSLLEHRSSEMNGIHIMVYTAPKDLAVHVSGRYHERTTAYGFFVAFETAAGAFKAFSSGGAPITYT